MILEILEVLSNLTGIDKSEFSAALKKNADGDELKTPAEIGQYLETAFGSKFQQIGETNLKRGKREALSGLEKEIRTKFELESQLKGVDLIEHLVNSKVDSTAGGSQKKKEYTDEELLKLPKVQELINSRMQEKDTTIQDLTSQIDGIRNEQHNNQKREIIRTSWLGLNPVIASEGDLREKQINAFLNSMDLNGFALKDESGQTRLVPVDSNGEMLKDKKYFNPVSLEDRIRELDYFGFHKHDPQKGSPSPKSKEKQPLGGDKDSPKFQNREELNIWINRNRHLGKESLQNAIKVFEQSEKE